MRQYEERNRSGIPLDGAASCVNDIPILFNGLLLNASREISEGMMA
jgi:hypothetical protein